MLHLILNALPAPLHRLTYRAASGLRGRWRRWRKPLLLGCRVFAFDDAGRIAFVRLSYGFAGWSLPGGGIDRGERPLDAAVREFREETGCTLIDPVEFGISEETSHGAPNRVHLVTGRAAGALAVDGREVLEAGWFAPGALPAPLLPKLEAQLAPWITAARAAGRQPETPPPAPPPFPTG